MGVFGSASSPRPTQTRRGESRSQKIKIRLPNANVRWKSVRKPRKNEQDAFNEKKIVRQKTRSTKKVTWKRSKMMRTSIQFDMIRAVDQTISDLTVVAEVSATRFRFACSPPTHVRSERT